jgi:mannonate dehydratase
VTFVHLSLRIHSLAEDELTFIQQLGVTHVDVGPPVVGQPPKGKMPGFQEQRLDLDRVKSVIRGVRDAGLEVAFFADYPPIRPALLGAERTESLLEDVCRYLELLGSEGVPVSQLCLEMLRHGPGGVPGAYMRRHRGGYAMRAFSLALMRQQLAERDLTARWAHHFTDQVTPAEYFDRCVEILERVVPVAEAAGVKLALHTDDPPVPDGEGLLPGITNPLLINRLFEAVPSRNLGLLFCCGTRYESGVDLYEQIRMFGGRGKVFHIHLRNVRGTIPIMGAYEEVAIDDGDLDIVGVVQAFQAVGYDGAIYPDHVPLLTGDPQRRAALAHAVGYVQAILSAL